MVSLQDHLGDDFEEAPTVDNPVTERRGYGQVIRTATIRQEVQEACNITLSKVEGGGQSSGCPLPSAGPRHSQGPPSGGVASARRSTGPPLHQQPTNQGKAPGGGPVRPTVFSRHSSRRPDPSGPQSNVHMSTGPLYMPSSSKSPSQRAAKRAKLYMTWIDFPTQAQEACNLLRGEGPFKMTKLQFIPQGDSRHSVNPNHKWSCAYCGQTVTLHVDGQGHTLSTHSTIHSNALCQCGTGFTSAKVLTYHLDFVHNIDATSVKKDPTQPLIKDPQKSMKA